MLRDIYRLLRKEIQQELSEQNATLVILLYVLSSVYVTYLCFTKVLSISTWNALFWVIVLFGAFNATLRVFDKEQGGKDLFLSQLVAPQVIYWAKAVFASLLSIVVAGIGFACFVVFMGLPSETTLASVAWFGLLILLAGLGLGALLALINGIAFKSGNSIGMASILGLPLSMPLVILLIRISTHILAGQPIAVFQKYFLSLLALDLIILVLASLLFPYLWRD
ncbi:hypothetical protein [Luteibaculum oceani]|uniref:ABC transporter permease n=1 Tax=Luteibaculum oceani TaxID=1294296 RepID=A0A5C6V190_9FLAO|nr:hypothetical protein [Luteibaculum oceani]TXC77058.1 hypothetical protein FRX97_09340 [Luteibaculum oceani]